MEIVWGYFGIGCGFFVLHLWAKKKLGEKITTSSFFSALLAIPFWLPLLAYFSILWVQYYRERKKFLNEMRKIIEGVIENRGEEEETNEGS